MPRPELCEAGVCAVERLECFPVSAETPEQLGELAIRIAFERQILRRGGDVARLDEVRFGASEIARLTRDDAVDFRRFAVGARIVEVLRKRHGTVAAPLGFVKVALLDLERRRIHFELHARRETAERVGDRERLGECLLRRIVAAECHVRQAEVVERDDDVVEEGMSAAVRERFLEMAQGFAEVAANTRHRAQVGHHVDLETRIGGARSALERFLKELLGVVQITLTPAHGGQHVQRVTQRVPLLAQLGGRDRSDSAVLGGGVVGVHFVGASDPPQQHRRQRWRWRGERTESLLVLHACFGSAAELVECACLLDQCVD